MPKARSFFSFERIILICAGFFLYAITLLNGYAIDDTLVTVKPNITTEGVKVIPKLLTSSYGVDDAGQKYDYRPLVKVSYALEHGIFGVSPALSHFFNILLYTCCVLLVYRFLILFVDDKSSKMPFYIAILFAFLPIHTEVAASLKNRDILLCFIFCMLSCIHLLKAFSSPVKWVHVLLAWVFLNLGFMSKFDAFPFTVILPFLVFIKFKPGIKTLLVLLLIFVSAYILSRVNLVLTAGPANRGVCYFENPLFFTKTLHMRTVALFNCLGFYATQCVMPLKQVCYYGEETIPVTSLHTYGYFGISIAIALLAGFVYAFKKNKKGLLLGLFIFVASSSMYLNFFQPAVGIVADRFIFFGSLGFCISVLFLIEPLLAGRKKMLSIVALGLLTVYGTLIILRGREWKNSATLIAADYPKYPNSAFLNYLYATAIMDTLMESKKTGDTTVMKARVNRIKDCLGRSLSISNDYPKALGFLSSVLVFMDKDYKAALPVINRGLEVQKTPDLIFYKGICLHQLKVYDSSEVYLLETIQLNPSPHPAYGLLMENYLSTGAYERSLELFNAAMKKGYENQQVYNGLATTYLALNDTLSVEFYCQKTLSIDPENKEAKELLNRISQR